jgi:hypothetical protein
VTGSRPDFSAAIVDDMKLSGYLFNPDHNEGWPKGRFLLKAGFLADELDAVRAAIIVQAGESQIVTTTTHYGTKLECDGDITSPTGESRRVRTVWQSDNETNLLRFVTFKPLRKHL